MVADQPAVPVRIAPRRAPRVLVLSVPHKQTPYREWIPSEQLQLIEAALGVRGWPVHRAQYHPGTITSLVGAMQPDVILNLAYGYVDAHVRQDQAEVARHLELLGCSCVGSSAAAQRVAQDKMRTAEILRPLGVRCPVEIDPRDWPAEQPAAVLKPRSGACHRDVRVVMREDRERLDSLPGHDWLLQEYVAGPEFTVAVLEDGSTGELQAFPPVKICFKACEASDRVVMAGAQEWFPVVDPDAPGALAETALAAFRALELRDYARFDFRVSSSGPVLLDANALPGLHPRTSFYILAANAAQWDYHRVIWRLADNALSRTRATAE